MRAPSSPIYAFNSSLEAKEILRSLGRSGFDMKSVTRVGGSYLSTDTTFNFSQLTDTIKSADDVIYVAGSLWRAFLSLFAGEGASGVVVDHYGLMLSETSGNRLGSPGRNVLKRSPRLKSV